MSENKMLSALEYARKGFAVFPCHNVVEDGVCSCSLGGECRRIGKHPRTANGLHDATTDLDTIAQWWQRWPDANPALSMVGTSMAVIDIDTKDDKDGRLWLSAHDDDIPPGPRQHTPSGGQHIFLKIPPDANVRPRSDVCAPGVDVRANEGYVMLAPSDHVAGSRYYFDDDLGEVDVPDCPEWLLEQIVSREVESGLVPELTDFEFDKIKSALAVLPSDLPNDQWIQVIMGIHSVLPDEEGFQIALEWSQTSESHSETEKSFRPRWRSLKDDGGVTPGVIYKMAVEHGWVEPSDDSFVIDVDAMIMAQHARAEAESNEIDGRKVVPLGKDDFKRRGMPQSVLRGARVGMLGRYMDWVDECNQFSDATELSLASGLAMFASVFSRFFRVSGARPNVYVVGVCRPGGGKNAGLTCSRNVLMNGAFADRLGENDFGSGASVIKSIQKSASKTRLFAMDEFSIMLSQAIQEGKGAQAWKQDIGKKLLELYSASDGVYTDTARKEEETELLYQPHINLYGVCTPIIYEKLNGAAVSGGLLSRFLFIDVPNRPPRSPTMEEIGAARGDGAPPDEIMEPLGRLFEWMTDQLANSGNLGAATIGDSFVYDFEMTPGAFQIRSEAIQSGYRLSQRKGAIADLWVRMAEQSTKFAMIRCLCSWMTGDLSSPPVLTETDMKWAIDLVVWSVTRLEQEITQRTARNMTESQLKDVLRTVMAGEGEPVLQNDIFAENSHISVKQIREVCARLVSTGRIKKTKVKTGKRGQPPTAYIPTRLDEGDLDEEEIS